MITRKMLAIRSTDGMSASAFDPDEQRFGSGRECDLTQGPTMRRFN